MFRLPPSLWPRRESEHCFVVPNVAVGHVLVEQKHLPIFSAFFSHAMFLPSNQWTLISVPCAEPKSTPNSSKFVPNYENKLNILIDPPTLHMFGSSLIAICMDPSRLDDHHIAAIKLYLPPDTLPNTHWTNVGKRYQLTYTMLKKSKLCTTDKNPTQQDSNSQIIHQVVDEMLTATPCIQDDNELI